MGETQARRPEEAAAPGGSLSLGRTGLLAHVKWSLGAALMFGADPSLHTGSETGGERRGGAAASQALPSSPSRPWGGGFALSWGEGFPPESGAQEDLLL